MRDQLKDHIKATIEGIQHLSVDDAAACAEQWGGHAEAQEASHG